ncbi:hypothetical protein E2C01_041255 [Portunus trituberculatus]|uniref:Uncharacterized protein n=1 Tax=Portunus trituberculatus TaxID=210409 RepID=A0A5B7FPX6_PORTR|nr:hypothetical protein [Portunus trituberculatus]
MIRSTNKNTKKEEERKIDGGQEGRRSAKKEEEDKRKEWGTGEEARGPGAREVNRLIAQGKVDVDRCAQVSSYANLTQNTY